MAKVVMIPRKGEVRPGMGPSEERCVFHLQGRTIEFDCSGCPHADDAPSERCLGAIRNALIAHREATGMIMHGTRDVWVREGGINSLRTMLAAEMAWEGLRDTLSSLPCTRPISPERINRYLERVRGGSSELFCQGEGTACTSCLERQREAMDALCYDGRKARRTMAVDRFRIIEVPGGSER